MRTILKYKARRFSMTVEIYDVTILGGGPSGLYSAFYAGLRDLKTKIIEVQPRLGGKINVYPDKLIWDIGALPPTTGEKVMEYLINQAMTFGPTVVLNSKVEMVAKENDLFVVTTHDGVKHYSKTVIVAVGDGIINPVKLDIEGAEKYEVANLHYTVRGIERFKDKSILISGGGNAAIDWALDLIGIAKDITLIYRGEELKAHEGPIKKLLSSDALIYTNTEIERLIADQEKTYVETVVAANRKTGEQLLLNPDHILIHHGFDRKPSLTIDEETCPVERDAEDPYYIRTNNKCESSLPGLFAVGNICLYEGQIVLIVGCFQDAMNAVNYAKMYLEPGAKEIGTVSSHNHIFDDRNREIIKAMVMQESTN
jgi:thioredoxin reductase